MQGLETSLFTRHRHASHSLFFLFDKSRLFSRRCKMGFGFLCCFFWSSFCTFGAWEGLDQRPGCGSCVMGAGGGQKGVSWLLFLFSDCSFALLADV